MPPAATQFPHTHDVDRPVTPTFDVGVIEVQALEGRISSSSSNNSKNGSRSNNNSSKRYATRILLAPGHTMGDEDDIAKTNTTNRKSPYHPRLSAASLSPVSVAMNRYEMGESNSNNSRYGGRSRGSGLLAVNAASSADSFDSTDEIVENSNEANLFKRIVERRATDYQHHQQKQQQHNYRSSFQRADSFSSDTNSVNSNEPFVIEESQEMEYLDVFDQHLVDTDPRMANEYSQMDGEMDDSHPNKRHPHQNPLPDTAIAVDDLIDHLCAGPCGECTVTDPVGVPFGSSIMVVGGSALPPKPLPPALRKPCRYSGNGQIRRSSISSLEDTTHRMERDTTGRGGDTDDDFDNHVVPDRYCCVPSSTTTSPSSMMRKRSVNFKNVDIREFKMTLGNHPSATSGPPVMLSGDLNSPRKVMTLEQYEQTRPPRRKRRQLKLSLQQRHNVLVKERGFSFEEVKGAWQEALEIRKQRKETLERGLAMMKWDEVWESTCRKFNRLVDGSI